MMRQAFLLLFLFLCIPCRLSAQSAGDSVLLTTIAIEGANKTRPQIILNELAVIEGERIARSDLSDLLTRSEQNVYNLGLFNEVVITEYQLNEELTLIVKVVERWYIYGSPYLQVEERNSYDLVNALLELDFHRLVYGASVQWKNVTGRNETITFFGQLGFSQRFLIDINRPTLSRTRMDHRLGFGYQNQHEIIIGTENGRAQWRRVESEPLITVWKGYVGGRRRFGLYKTLYTELRFDHIRMSDSLQAFTLENGPPGTLTQASGREYFPSLIVQYYEDTRDYRGFPLSGWKYQVLGKFSGGIPGISTTTFGKVGLTWAQHVPVGRKLNFAWGTQHILTIGDSLPFFSKSFLGIAQGDFVGVSSNLRGYEPFAIGATYMGVLKTEWKYALIPRQIVHFDNIPLPRFRDVQMGLYLSVFADLAYLQDRAFNGADQTFHNQLLTGYGAGLNVIGFYDMLLRIEYSRNRLNQGGIYFHTDLQIK